MPVHGAFAGRGPQQRRQEADGSALAGPVRTNEPKHLAGADRQIQILHGHEFAVHFGKVAKFDHVQRRVVRVVIEGVSAKS
jgi:hypothetical protein